MKEDKDVIDRLVEEWGQERPELDAKAMHIVGRIIKLGKTLEKQASDALKGFDIYYTDLDVLATIRRSGKPYRLAPKQLMKSVLITSGAMTALLDRLTKLELIYRVPDEHDKRIKLACLTEKGITVIDKAIVERFDVATSAVQHLDAKKRGQLAKLLKELLMSID